MQVRHASSSESSRSFVAHTRIATNESHVKLKVLKFEKMLQNLKTPTPQAAQFLATIRLAVWVPKKPSASLARCGTAGFPAGGGGLTQWLL